jgi:hypothetical protein
MPLRSILNAGRNETFVRGSLYRESLIRGRELYKPLPQFHGGPRESQKAKDQWKHSVRHVGFESTTDFKQA